MQRYTVYLAAWLGLALLAILNGHIRNTWYGPTMSELSAHQLSTIAALMLFSLYLFGLTRVVPLQSAQQAFAIGGTWLAMTIAFEFVFGHFVAGHSWQVLFRDYNLFAGRLWLLVLVWTFFAPYAAYQLNRQ